MKPKITIAVLWIAMVFVNNEKVTEAVSLSTHLLAPPTTSPTKIAEEMKKRLDNLKERHQRIQNDLSLFGEDFFLSHAQGGDQLARINDLMRQVEGTDMIEQEYGYGLELSGFNSLIQLLRRLISNMEGELANFKEQRKLKRDVQIDFPDELVVGQLYDVTIQANIPPAVKIEKDWPTMNVTISISAPTFDIVGESLNRPMTIVPNQDSKSMIQLIPREIGTCEVQITFYQAGHFLGFMGFVSDVRRAPIYSDQRLGANL